MDDLNDHRATSLRLGEVLGALSYALDLTEGQPAGHCIRCCYIGMEIGRELQLSPEQARGLYYTLLLKDLGCSSNAARICELYLNDDIAIKHDFKLLDGSLLQVLSFVLSHTGPQSGLSQRFRALQNILQNGTKLARDVIETRCVRGAEIARKIRFDETVAEGIKNLDEHWDGSGKPGAIKGYSIPLYSRIALLAQVVDVFQMAGGSEAARREVKKRTASWFDPALAKIFERISQRQAFWTALNSAKLQRDIFDLEPAMHVTQVDEDYLDDIATGFAQVVDLKSPYTAGHSERVTAYTDIISRVLKFPEERRRWLRRAALLHDIGKLGVSNAILDKPGQLTASEWVIVKQHPTQTERILSRVKAFENLAAVAGAHHERLDGKGYPKGLKGDEIRLESRILAVADIFDALTAKRPYRSAMTVPLAFETMDKMEGVHIDANCLRALKQGFDSLVAVPADTKHK